MKEYDLIRQLAGKFPRSPQQTNALFACDAEIVNIGGQLWGITIDEHTPGEDRFSSEDPAALGRNLIAATLSDLLAAGAEPRFFLSSLGLPRKPRKGFVDRLTTGMSAALAEANCALCGGDLGVADPWRFTGFAMGPVTAAGPLTRRVPAATQALCITGTLGDMNLAAFLGAPTPAIELRMPEAAFIRKYATACIDTSGGFFDALWLLHEQSPGRRFFVERNAIPFASSARQFAASSEVPAEAVLLGGAGEYELLFTLPAAMLNRLRLEMGALGISVIGSVTEGKSEIVLRSGTRQRRISSPPPCPRSAANAEAHAREAIRMARELVA